MSQISCFSQILFYTMSYFDEKHCVQRNMSLFCSNFVDFASISAAPDFTFFNHRPSESAANLQLSCARNYSVFLQPFMFTTALL